ncbi:SsgA family sporulation/cell division regulator [Streptomyces brasiliensis]|uniref:Sporulation-specific cell division protein SsgB n=1 Tax=Streptomyces brasiliensis TaxID=1954 RepID=A0A917UNM8_9ACTN|nr:SsgA family sporulation/cell division regulator [Streptomyces brasiliensis]GGJ70765.1 sporulation-specific cell division protein SsgB [Streptomyces brasiliensis]
MNEPATSVVCAVTVTVAVPGEPTVVMPAELCYDVADPYAARLSLGAPEMEPVDWVFARSLLAEGMHRPAGVGRVLVSPPHRCHRHSVRVVVRSTSSAARIEVPSVEAGEFLRRSYALVPDGAESLYIDVDRELAALMDGCD